MHSNETISQLEMNENESILTQIHEFNVQESSKNLKELAINGIGKMKSLFQRLNIKSTLQSFFKKENNIESPNGEEPIESTNIKESIESKPIEEQEDGPKVLKEFDSLNIGSIKSEIRTYYRENYTDNIRKAIITKYPKIPNAKIDIAVERAITKLSEKPIEQFKSKIATQLEARGVFKEDFARFWQWRLKNPPRDAVAKFVSTDTGNELLYENFISDFTIDRFLDQHTSTLPEEFFDEINGNVSIPKPKPDEEITPQTSEDLQNINIYTSEDIDNVFTKELNEFAQEDVGLSEEEFINTIVEQSNGWVDAQMYNNIANISIKDALAMLGSINSDLKPSTRTALSEIHNIESDTTASFGTFIQNHFTKNNSFSKKNIRIASDIITQLNKVVISNKQK